MQQTKTTFSGEMTQQLIKDIPCEVIHEKSEPMEVLKETESNENTDTSVNEEVMEQSSQEEEK